MSDLQACAVPSLKQIAHRRAKLRLTIGSLDDGPDQPLIVVVGRKGTVPEHRANPYVVQAANGWLPTVDTVRDLAAAAIAGRAAILAYEDIEDAIAGFRVLACGVQA